MHILTTRALAALASLPLVLAACGDGTGPGTTSRVAVRFGRAGAGSAAVSPASSGARYSQAAGGAAPLVMQGTNGTLSISGIGFVVSELELECDDDSDEGAATACAEFEAPPSFVQLPLGTGAVEVATTSLPAGTYDELEFEVENLASDDDDHAEKRARIAGLLATIRGSYADFPDRASMVVEGTFTPAGAAQGTPFRAYFDAEIKVEMELAPPLAVSDAGASRALSVNVEPARWFTRADGTVLDLSQLDYARTGAVVGFEAKMEAGFSKVELDD